MIFGIVLSWIRFLQFFDRKYSTKTTTICINAFKSATQSYEQGLGLINISGFKMQLSTNRIPIGTRLNIFIIFIFKCVLKHWIKMYYFL